MREMYLDMGDACEELGMTDATLRKALAAMGVLDAVCVKNRPENTVAKCRITAEPMARLRQVIALRNELQISIPAAIKVLAKVERDRERSQNGGSR